MAIPQRTVYIHSGPWDASSRSYPALEFLEAYTSKIKSCDLSGPFEAWYAPSTVFFNADGKVYRGGQVVWEWIGKLFAPYRKMGEQDESQVARLVVDSELVDQTGHRRKGDLILYEHVMVFYPKLGGEGIPVRRMMEFVVGESEVAGQGTKGLQIWQGKVWWDTAVLQGEMERRKVNAGSH